MFEGFKEHTLLSKDNLNLWYCHNFNNSFIERNLPVLFFNYGLVCSNAHFKFQIPYFSSLGYPIIYHDYRFHFKSSSSQNIQDLTFANISHDMETIIKELNLDQVIMIGHSMGVNTTLDFAYRHPKKLKGMILISGTVLPPQDVMFDSNGMDIMQPILELLLAKYPRAFKAIWQTGHKNPIAELAIHRGGFNTKKVPLEFVTHYLEKIGKLDPSIFFKLLDEMRKQNISSKLQGITTEALVIGGDLDQVIPNYLQYILVDNLPKSEMYIVKEGSHVPQADFPETINERIGLFLSQNN